jgi:hypothetical protein
MEALYLLAVAALTSLAVLAIGRRALGLELRLLSSACTRALEICGATLLFWALNVALALGAALLVRRLGATFLSAYLGTDPALLVVALLQALVFESWRAHSRASSK